MAERLRWVTMVGSLRAGSQNRILAEALPALAPAGVEIEPLASLGGLPHYDADIQARGFPAEVSALGEAIRAADGVVIVSPEYNYSIPGVLKNAIDWLSRLPEQPFVKKPVAIQSVSPGPAGGTRMQHHLRQALLYLEPFVLARPEILIGGGGDKFTDSGLTDERTRRQVAAQLAAFADFVRLVTRPPG